MEQLSLKTNLSTVVKMLLCEAHEEARVLLDRYLATNELNEESLDEETIDCTADWGAKRALTYNNRIYYVRYNHAILVFGDSEVASLSEEQIDIILKKLELR